MRLNHREYSEFREGMTIQDVLDERHFTWHNLIIRLNGNVIRPEQYNETVLDVRDELEVIHLMAGG